MIASCSMQLTTRQAHRIVRPARARAQVRALAANSPELTTSPCGLRWADLRQGSGALCEGRCSARYVWQKSCMRQCHAHACWCHAPPAGIHPCASCSVPVRTHGASMHAACVRCAGATTRGGLQTTVACLTAAAAAAPSRSPSALEWSSQAGTLASWGRRRRLVRARCFGCHAHSGVNPGEGEREMGK
jgi:hypothetical protein